MIKKRFARRLFLKAAAAPVGLGLIPSGFFAQTTAQTPAQDLAARRNPGVALNVRGFGAAGDGTTKDTAAIQQGLDRCAVLGGGEVLVPAGNYLTGAIALRSNTILRLDKDASILGSPDFADYPVTQVRWEGKWIQGAHGLDLRDRRQQHRHRGARQDRGQSRAGRPAECAESSAASGADRAHRLQGHPLGGFLHRTTA